MNDIQERARELGWSEFPELERARGIYDFVRDEVLFGRNVKGSITRLHVLSDSFGQCSTKGTLCIAILRLCAILALCR